MKRRSVVLSDLTYQRLVRLKKDFGINISDSVEFLATHHLSTLEQRVQMKDEIKDLLRQSVDQMIISVIIIEAAMPCMANIVIVAKIYKVDDHLATSNVFMSTLLSMITLPLIWWLINQII